MRRIAIIGQGPGAEFVPDDLEKWGFPWTKDYSLDLYFEIHARDTPAWDYYGKDPAEFFGDFPSVVYLLDELEGAENTREYPLGEAMKLSGDYLECSVSYALALAIMESVAEINLFGISGNDKYATQRPNIEYLIGFARGRGIVVNVEDDSLLLKSEFPSGRYGID